MSTDRIIETEIKIKIDSLAHLIDQMRTLEFTLHRPRSHEYNIVFDTPNHRLKKQGKLLRLRQSDQQCRLTFKGRPDQKADIRYKKRVEIETDISDFEQMKAILLSLGYQIFFIYEKFQQIYKRDLVKIMIDETPIGNYIEIEGSEVDIDQVAFQLGFSIQDYLVDTYYDLFKKVSQKKHMIYD